MKRTLAVLFALILFLALVLCGVAHAESRAQIHKTTHKIEMKTKVGDDETCSSTAVGPQTLLTASHCELPTDKLKIDIDDEAQIVKIIRDGNDHSFLLLTGVRFEHWAQMNRKNAFEPGDRVYIFGNPNMYTDLYREGYYSGTRVRDTQTTDSMWDFNGFFGDSGSGLFNSNGDIIAVTSQMTKDFKMMVSLPLVFTDDQVKEATTYCKKCAPPKTKTDTQKLLDLFKGDK